MAKEYLVAAQRVWLGRMTVIFLIYFCLSQVATFNLG